MRIQHSGVSRAVFFIHSCGDTLTITYKTLTYNNFLQGMGKATITHQPMAVTTTNNVSYIG